jgi:hypothetical protein
MWQRAALLSSHDFVGRGRGIFYTNSFFIAASRGRIFLRNCLHHFTRKHKDDINDRGAHDHVFGGRL